MKNLKHIIPWRRKNAALTEPFAPFAGLENLRRQINDLFGAVGEGRADWPMKMMAAASWGDLPRFEVAETSEAVEVTAELPGLEEKDIQVTLEGQMLCICGEKKSKRDERKKSYHMSELSYGKFERMIHLPAAVDRSQTKAVFKNGVLRLTLSKTPEEKSRRKQIAITTE